MPLTPSVDGEPEDPAAALRDVRDRFVVTFAARCDAVAHLIDRLSRYGDGEHGSHDALYQIVHRLGGLAGTIGFPDVSHEALAIEDLLQRFPAQGLDPHNAAVAVDRLRDAFTRDLQRPAPDWDVPARSAPRASRVLVIEDDDDQARLLVTWLRHAGYGTARAATGEAGVAAMAVERPDLVLLDVGLPGLDGYGVCQRLKTAPDLTRTPVIFLTTRASVDDRLLGLALGADDYVTKPADRQELLLRIRLRLRGFTPGGHAGGGSEGSPWAASPTRLTYAAFTMVAAAELRQRGASLALIRAPIGAIAAVTDALVADARIGDIVSGFDGTHLIAWFPDLAQGAAHARVYAVLKRLVAEGHPRAHAGLATSVTAGAPLDDLLSRADEALVAARQRGDLVATSAVRDRDFPALLVGTALLTDTDPRLFPAVDALMRSAGLKTVRASDCDRAIDAVRTERPDLLLLDLLSPALRGFDVLRWLADYHTRPRTIVLAGRGQDDEVTQAFELGADDYVTRPFTPGDLIARMTRLLR